MLLIELLMQKLRLIDLENYEFEKLNLFKQMFLCRFWPARNWKRSMTQKNLFSNFCSCWMVFKFALQKTFGHYGFGGSDFKHPVSM